MSSYIDVTIDTDPQDIIDDFVTFMQTFVPGWQPSAGQLDFWIAQMIAPAAADARDVASAVPKSIFRWFGANLINLPPIDATPATVLSTWTVADNAGYTIPAGTQVTIAATGTDVFAFETTVDTLIPPGSTVAANVLLTAVEPGEVYSGLGGAGVQATLIDPLTFVSLITLAAATTGGVDAEDDDTYLTRLRAELQLLAPRPILPGDFAVFARQIAGVGRATAIDGYNPFHNLLTADEASFETGVANYAGTNATLAQTAAQALDGTKSLQLTASSAADMSAALTAGNQKAVTPGETITAIASFRSAVTARSVKVGIAWYTAASALISTSFGGAVNDSAAAWTGVTVTAQAPATAAFARIVYFVTAPANAEVHYVDKTSIRRGSGTDWVAGGTGETSQPRTISVAATDDNGAALDTTHKNAVDADLQARREVNFIVYVIDPNISAIDVTWQVKALAGYDLAALVTSINTALAQYINPATWGTGDDPNAWANTTVVRYLEVAQIINQVAGVDYITTTAGNMDLQLALHGFALGRTDVTLPGVAPLPTTTGATISGTAT